MKFIFRHLEIIFTVAGLAVIFGVTALFTPAGAGHWPIAAVTATLVGVIHGLLFWLVRRRQRQVRLAAIAEMQAMLSDIINNQLAVILTMASLREANPAEAQRACDYTTRSVRAISDALAKLSDDSLRSWNAKYPRRTEEQR